MRGKMATFDDVIGQEQIIEHMRNAIRYNKVANAYLICGERSCGKEFLANIFAEALECEETARDSSEITDPCGKCHSCIQAEGGNQPDIIHITHDKPNIVSVDDVRKQVIGDIAIRPYSSRYKIYIMNEAEKMNQQAQNALLKTLEEPPAYAVIILLTTNAEALLPTILSRCVTLQMKPVSDEALRAYLMKELKIPDYKADLCTAFARGNVGKARLLAINDEFDHIIEEASALLKNITDMDQSEVAGAVSRIKNYNIDISDYLDILAVWYRDALLYKATNDTNHLIFRSNEQLSAIRVFADHASYEGVEAILGAIDQAKRRLAATVNYDLTMELLFLSIQENS